MTTRDLYLNHAGTSWPKPHMVAEAVQEAVSISPAQWPQRFHEAHQAVANFFGVSRREQILLTPGCTSALALGLGDVAIAPGKRVLTSCWEHHALHRPLLRRASSGVRVETIPPGGSGPKPGHVSAIDFAWLREALSQGDVGLVAITAASNVTGELLPYEEVIHTAHQYGAKVFLDAAQIVGWEKLDLSKLDADMVAFGGHKGLQAPWGIGGMYLSDRVEMECTSAKCEVPVPGQSADDKAPRPGYCDVGSVDQVALAGLHAAIRWLRHENTEAHLAHARSQIQRIGDRLGRFDRLHVFGPTEAKKKMPTVSFALPGFSSNVVASQLRQRSLIVGSGLQCAPLAHQTLGTHALGVVRISVGMGQPDDEIEEATDRLVSVLNDEF